MIKLDTSKAWSYRVYGVTAARKSHRASLSPWRLSHPIGAAKFSQLQSFLLASYSLSLLSSTLALPDAQFSNFTLLNLVIKAFVRCIRRSTQTQRKLTITISNEEEFNLRT